MEAIILAGDVDAGDVVVLPDARETVLVKQVRLGQGGFILTVAPVDDDKPEAERFVTLTGRNTPAQDVGVTQPALAPPRGQRSS